ncbi:hypothetical protein PN4B1_40560 [Paenibacillus naphthalenovorans]|uniref:hypothetical protein n=1 Tax=Paenibacillus naphthalenovorans TaxID=162209 RepID=UPI0010B6D4B3|nr:hypothetical protein [Paenibacillus naphthalenovorans]GCL74114.1 hypothetical protein PN4B1_40560 [Paenibacillus naphthalenovorans]
MSHYREFYTSPVIRFIAVMSLLDALLTCLHFDGYVTILALFFGALVYAFAEYVVHRYLPKLVPALYWRHVEHHKHPQELKYLFSPVYHDVLIYSAYIPLVWL